MTRTLLCLLFLAGLATAQTPPAKPDAPKPIAPVPDVEKALELFNQRKYPDALELLKKAAKANPLLPPPKVQFAQWFLQAGSGRDARVYIEQAIAEDNRHPEGYLLNANFALNEGRLTDGLLSLQMALQLAADPRWDADQRKRFTKEARTGLAAVYHARGDFDAAKESVLGLLNDDPKNAPLRMKLGEVLFAANRPEEAFAELSKAFADDATLDPPELHTALLWQTRANAQTDPVKAETDRKKAEEFYKKAVAVHQKVPKCHQQYAVWLMEDGKVDAAGLYVEAVGKIDPTGRDTAATRALWHVYRKEYAAAEALLEGIMKDSPGDSFAVGYLALCLAESGDEKKKKRAVELAETLVRQNQKAALPYSILGWCLLKSGRTDEADKALGTAASGGPMTCDTAYFAARLLVERQKFEEAHRLLKDATAVPHGPFVYRTDAKTLLAEVAKKVPDKKDDPKK